LRKREQSSEIGLGFGYVYVPGFTTLTPMESRKKVNAIAGSSKI